MRHAEPAEDENTRPPPDASGRDAVVSHVTRVVGKPCRVIRPALESVNADDDVEIHVIPPTRAHPAWLLHTLGMSDREMIVPRGMAVPQRAELLLRLPLSWPIDGEAAGQPRWDWPLRWLRQLARLPHAFDTWLGHGHTVPNGDPARPLGSGTKQCCILVLAPSWLASGARVIREGEPDAIALYSLYPIYEEEMTLKLREGVPSLLSRFEACGVRDVIDPARRSAARRSKFFGLF